MKVDNAAQDTANDPIRLVNRNHRQRIVVNKSIIQILDLKAQTNHQCQHNDVCLVAHETAGISFEHAFE